MFSVYGEAFLDPITTAATSSEITAWKRSRKTAESFKYLYENHAEEDITYMARILEKLWPKGQASQELIAFAMSVCETILNPDNDVIQINEGVIKQELIRNKVSINRFPKYFKKILQFYFLGTIEQKIISRGI